MKVIFYLSALFVFFNIAPVHSQVHPQNENSFVLKIMNYNIKGLPLPWLKHTKRYKNIANDLLALKGTENYPHVISFQEAMAKKTKVVPEMLNYPYYDKGPKRKFLRSNAGLITVSSLKMEKIAHFRYSRCISWDCLAHKGVQYIRMAIPNSPVKIQILNTHMQAGPSSDPITPQWKTDEIRAHQAGEFINFMHDQIDHTQPVILLGDFNFRPSSDIYSWFVSLTGTKNTAYECGVNLDCAGEDNPYLVWLKLIDHQFYTSSNPAIQIVPIYFEKLFKERLHTDHDATMVHYLISW